MHDVNGGSTHHITTGSYRYHIDIQPIIQGVVYTNSAALPAFVHTVSGVLYKARANLWDRRYAAAAAAGRRA